MVKKLSFIWMMFLAFLSSEAQIAKSIVSKPNHPSAIEERIVDTVFRLRECKQRATYIAKQTKGKRHLDIVIYQRPSKDYPYYWVKAWENNGVSYTTHFNFYIYTKPFAIKFYDAVNDKTISLKEWRQQVKL